MFVCFFVYLFVGFFPSVKAYPDDIVVTAVPIVAIQKHL